MKGYIQSRYIVPQKQISPQYFKLFDWLLH